jgi:hypothetical protein
MSRASVNFLVDCCLLLNFVIVLATTLMLRALFPHPTHADEWTVWGLGYDRWANVQFWAVMSMAAVVLLHLILHWNWVCGFVAGRIARFTGRRAKTVSSLNTLYGVTLLIVILSTIGAFLLVAQFSVVSPEAVPATPGTHSTQIRAR